MALIVAAAVTAAAQQQQPTFKAGTQTVPLFATVTDATGRLIPDLAKEDFEIFDNNKSQAVTLFVNDLQFIKVVVMLDESASMVNNIARGKEGAEQFLLRLLPDDRARIGSFEDKIIVSPEFSNNRTDPDPSLKKIAAESGGGYFELKEGADLSSTFTRVAQELHSQYVIGFTPESMDGKLHALQMRVKRPGMTARARKSYIASPDK